MLGKNLIAAAAGNTDAGNPWDISAATFNGSPVDSISTKPEDGTPSGVGFNNDGTKFYLGGDQGDDVNEYDLATAWDIATVSYVQNFDVSAYAPAPSGPRFKSDGTKMYVCSRLTDDVVEYNLSTAWDISTASFSYALDVFSQESEVRHVTFKPDGTYMYIVGNNADNVRRYDLSTAWDISTASIAQSKDVSAEDTAPVSVEFKSDGTKMFVLGQANDTIYEYALSTAWDITTASYSSVSFNVNAIDPTPVSMAFKSDGTALFLLGNYTDRVFKFDLSTAWDLSTASFTYPTTNYVSLAAQDNNIPSIVFKSDGTKALIIGQTADNILEYTLSTAWEISTASYVQAFSIAAQDTNPVGIDAKPDGTTVYIVGLTNDNVYQYSLSTAWDISTASFVQSFSVNAQSGVPRCLKFKDDGTKFYVSDENNHTLFEYSLSTAWDISTASYQQSFLDSTNSPSAARFGFKIDGTKMYLSNADIPFNITEYDLSTAWDISTATYLQTWTPDRNFYSTALDIVFKPDGSKVYFTNSSSIIWSYDL